MSFTTEYRGPHDVCRICLLNCVVCSVCQVWQILGGRWRRQVDGMLPQDPEECSPTPSLVVLLSSCSWVCTLLQQLYTLLHVTLLDYFSVPYRFYSHFTLLHLYSGLKHHKVWGTLVSSVPNCPLFTCLSKQRPWWRCAFIHLYDCLVPFQNLDLTWDLYVSSQKVIFKLRNLSCKQIQFNSIQTKPHARFGSFKKLLLKNQKPACQRKP